MYCGTDIFGNVFQRVTRAAFIGGGRDCRIENNIFVDCGPALHIDARALGWAKYHADEWVKEGTEKGTLSGIAYQKPPYRGRYPGLDAILAEDPCAPRGNVVARNICVGGRWMMSSRRRSRWCDSSRICWMPIPASSTRRHPTSSFNPIRRLGNSVSSGSRSRPLDSMPARIGL